MTLDARQVAAFLAVARSGSVGRAAASLAMTQPALSRSLKRLEAQLGAELFARHASGMELTVFGRALLPYAELLQSESQRAVEEIDMLRGTGKGLAKIGVVPSAASKFLPQAIWKLLARSPALRVTILEGSGGQLVTALRKGEIDFAVMGSPADPLDENVAVSALYDDEVCVVARHGHPAAAMAALSLADLLEYPWAMPSQGNVIWNHFRQVFRDGGLAPPTVAVEANSIHAVKALLTTTDFLTMIPRHLIALEEAARLVRTLQSPIPIWKRQVAVLRRNPGSMSPASSALLSQLRAAARETFLLDQAPAARAALSKAMPSAGKSVQRLPRATP